MAFEDAHGAIAGEAALPAEEGDEVHDECSSN